MSGPIVRKYGFPNFEKIFGERPIQHGSDEPSTGPAGSKPAQVPAQAAPKAAEADATKRP